MVVPVIIGSLGIVIKGLVKGLENLELVVGGENIQTPALLRSAWILRSVLETWGDFLSLRFQW